MHLRLLNFHRLPSEEPSIHFRCWPDCEVWPGVALVCLAGKIGRGHVHTQPTRSTRNGHCPNQPLRLDQRPLLFAGLYPVQPSYRAKWWQHIEFGLDAFTEGFPGADHGERGDRSEYDQKSRDRPRRTSAPAHHGRSDKRRQPTANGGANLKT
jgi:hypothetical protein